MKKCLVILGVFLFAFAFVAGDLMAGYQEALNVSGHRTQSRNAANGTIDAAYYNPAGLIAMKEGLYVDAGNRILSLTTKSKDASGLYFGQKGYETESSTMTYLLPNLALVYREGKAAVFYTLDIRAGGAGGEWSGTDAPKIAALALKGTPFAAAAGGATKVEGTTYTLGHTFGGSFALNEMVTVSAGLRYLQYNSEQTVAFNPALTGGLAKVEIATTMDGYAPFIGALVNPMPGLNIAIQYQGRAVLLGEDEVSSTGNPTAEQGNGNIQPTVLYFGVGYTAMPGLEIMFSYTREFSGELSYGAAGSTDPDDYIFGKDNVAKQVFGIGAEYRVDTMILVSAGLAYKMSGVDDANNSSPASPNFDEIDLGFGAVITAMPGLNVEVGFAYNIYSESAYTAQGVPGDVANHNRNSWIIGLGVTYQIF